MNVLSRPKLRGIIHLVMSPLALVAGLTLVTITSELRGRVTLTIFTLTAVSLFTCSAIYHRVPWGPSAKAVWRRIDRANIPLLIAGTYTPFAIYLLNKNQAIVLLSIVLVNREKCKVGWNYISQSRSHASPQRPHPTLLYNHRYYLPR